MAKVTTFNGSHGTSDGMTKYRFSGSPTDQFEHRASVGEVRTMQVTVECTAEGFDAVTDGVRHQTKWRVLEAHLGTLVERPDIEPVLPFDGEDGEDSEDPSYGDYTDEGQADGEDPGDDGDGAVVTKIFSDTTV
uniref:DUF7171 family protein n=1 Tax=Micromonospora sp. NBC_00855 TaxID=2975978 RepID=UPI00224CEFB8|nr:hypothetical protein OHB51_35440 [Micromonospora sp. NBC_00855]